MAAPELKANFAVQNKYGAFYTGGDVQMSKDGDFLFCQCGHTVQCLDVKSGKPSSAIGQEEDDEITSFVLSPDDEVLVVAHRNLLLKQWNWKEKIVTRTWKAIHTGPISCMTFDVTSTLLATGGADATIKVWDVIKQYCTHNLHGHSGVISVVAFHPNIDRLQLYSAGDDYKVRVWSLQTSSCVAALEGHYSVVTAIQFSPAEDRAYTAGRDNVVIVWDTDRLDKLRTIPVYEAIETLILMPEGRTFPALNVGSTHPHFVTGGSKGVLKVWNASTSQCVYPVSDQAEDGEEGSTCAITAAQLLPSQDALSVVTYDHNICIHDLQDFSPKKQFVGYNDDVLDMQFAGRGDSHLVVATNSQLVKVFEVSTWSCQVLTGHTDIVLSVGVNKDGTMFATGSKDNSVRLWLMEEGTGHFQCVAVGHGHTHAVNSVAFSRLQTSFLVSGSHDCTLKTWPLPDTFTPPEVMTLTGSLTEHAHEKEINSVAVTPNDKMIATGSQDKTAKLWTADKLSLLGTFRGHKRSIWCVQFSPVDQALATASADTTIKIWALSDFSCVKTFEGHQSSVLRLHFITRGMQIVSSGSDGLLKLWTIKTNECVGTWDEHDEKVWALAVPTDEQLIATGAGDSTICIWKDVTEEEQREALKKQEEFILQEQQLANLLQQKKYVKALGLAITLNQPYRVLNIFKELLDAEEGREDATRTLQKLRDDQIDSVLGFCAQWNTNSKHCHVAQFIIHVTLARYSPEELLKLGNIKSTIEALLPYTERHFQRMNRLQQQATFVDYTWQSMKFVSMLPADMEEEMTGIKEGQSTTMDVDSLTGRAGQWADSRDVGTIKPRQKTSRENDDSENSSSEKESESEEDSEEMKTKIKTKQSTKNLTSKQRKKATKLSQKEDSEDEDSSEEESEEEQKKPKSKLKGSTKIQASQQTLKVTKAGQKEDSEDEMSTSDDESSEEESEEEEKKPPSKLKGSSKSRKAQKISKVTKVSQNEDTEDEVSSDEDSSEEESDEEEKKSAIKPRRSTKKQTSQKASKVTKVSQNQDEMSMSDEDSSEEEEKKLKSKPKQSATKKTPQQASKATQKAKKNIQKRKNREQTEIPTKISMSDKENSDFARLKKTMNQRSPKNTESQGKKTKKQVPQTNDAVTPQQRKQTDSPKLTAKRRKSAHKLPPSSAKRRKSSVK